MITHLGSADNSFRNFILCSVTVNRAPSVSARRRALRRPTHCAYLVGERAPNIDTVKKTSRISTNRGIQGFDQDSLSVTSRSSLNADVTSGWCFDGTMTVKTSAIFSYAYATRCKNFYSMTTGGCQPSASQSISSIFSLQK